LNNNIISVIGAHLIRNRFDIVVMSPKSGILYGLFQSFFSLGKKPKLILFHFWLQDKTNSIISLLKDKLRTYALRNAYLIIVPSRNEIEFYSSRFNIPKSKFVYIPYHVHSKAWKFNNICGDYVFSAGSSKRDYDTLIKAARAIPYKKFVIVSDLDSVKNLSMPSNVELHTHIPHEAYLNKLSQCQICVIPLKNVKRSSGQRTILEAMAMSKPVIVSDIPGINDYIVNKKTGILIEPENHMKLIRQIEILSSNRDYATFIGSNAHNFARDHFLFEKNFETMFDLLNSICLQTESPAIPVT
jgi:glycosyltransferase involved in cell wall biosynthesis